MLEGQDWYCVDDKCFDKNGKRTVLGRIVKGELVVVGGRVNTDGTDVVVLCENCGHPKTWWPTDKKLIGSAYGSIGRVLDKVMRLIDLVESIDLNKLERIAETTHGNR